jgi:hypothetical protein
MEDSLMSLINKGEGDTAEVNVLAYLSNEITQFDSAIKYARQGLSLAEKINYVKGKADCLFVIARQNVSHGNFGTGPV